MDEGSKSKCDKGYETQLKILETAEQIFAEKGYDGARTDEIAKRAGVNKALIYYYFENKEQLLQAIIKKNRMEAQEIKTKLLKGMNRLDKEDVQKFFEGMFEFLKEKKDILRIISIEALKSSSKDVSIFSILLPTLDEIKSKFEKMGVNNEDILGIFIHSFFFNVVPISAFFTLGEKWADYYEVSFDDVMDKFQSLIKKQYISYVEENFK